MHSSLRFLSLAAVVIWRAAFAAEGGTQLKTEHFDRDPGWEGYNNHIVPKDTRMVTQDFGFSRTSHAGAARGEIGGRVQRAMTPASYAAPVAKTLDDPMSASGSFAIEKSNSAAGIFFGYFAADQPGGSGRPIGSFGIDLGFEHSGGRLAVRLITRENRSCGTFITPFIPGKYRPTPIKLGFAKYHFTMRYDPQANNGDGRFEFTLRGERAPHDEFEGKTFTVNLPPGYRKEGAKFERFGLMNATKSGGEVNLYFDDVTIDGKKEDFSNDPHWIGEGNRAKYPNHEPVGAHDFGFSPETNLAGGAPGEVGGGLWRTDKPWGYYGDRVGPLSLQQRLEARGKVQMIAAGPDSDAYFGWFVSADRNLTSSRECRFLGIHVGGPTRVGHYFAPAYYAAENQRAKVEKAPVIKPGRVYDWSLAYDPDANGGHGEMRVTLGEESVVLPLKPGLKKSSTVRLDRFGLFTRGPGGQRVKIYLDDLTYTVAGQ